MKDVEGSIDERSYLAALVIPVTIVAVSGTFDEKVAAMKMAAESVWLKAGDAIVLTYPNHGELYGAVVEIVKTGFDEACGCMRYGVEGFGWDGCRYTGTVHRHHFEPLERFAGWGYERNT